MDFSKLSSSELLDLRTLADYSARDEDPQVLFDQLAEDPQTVFPVPVVDLYIATNYTGPRNQTYSQGEILEMDLDTLTQLGQIFEVPVDGTRQSRERILRILKFAGLIHPDLKLATRSKFTPAATELLEDFTVPALADYDGSDDIIFLTEGSNLGDLSTYKYQEFMEAPVIETNGPIRLRMELAMDNDIIVRDRYLVPENGIITRGNIIRTIVENNKELNQYFKDYELDQWEAGDFKHVQGPYFEMSYFQP